MKCERCKEHMPTGSHAVRFHGRVWHHTCVAAYLNERKAPVRKTAPLPMRMRAKI